MAIPAMSPMLTPVAAAASANGAQMGAVLHARDIVAANADKGAGFIATLAAKLHLEVAVQWASRALGWVIGRLGFIYRVANFFGLKTTLAYILTSPIGQTVVKTAVKVATKVVTYPVRLLGRLANWASKKVGWDLGASAPVQLVSGLGSAVGSFVGSQLARVTNPNLLWMRVVHGVALFRINWALTHLSFIPGWIGTIAQVLLIAGAAVQIGSEAWDQYSAFQARRTEKRRLAAIKAATAPVVVDSKGTATARVEPKVASPKVHFSEAPTTEIKVDLGDRLVTETYLTADTPSGLGEKIREVVEERMTEAVELIDTALDNHATVTAAAKVLDEVLEVQADAEAKVTEAENQLVQAEAVIEQVEASLEQIEAEIEAAEAKVEAEVKDEVVRTEDAPIVLENPDYASKRKQAQMAYIGRTAIEMAYMVMGGHVPAHSDVMSKNDARAIIKRHSSDEKAAARRVVKKFADDAKKALASAELNGELVSV